MLVFAIAVSPAAAKDKNKKKNKASEQQQVQTDSTKVDLNTASEKDLDALPGVGSATVKKIVSNRPYSSVDDLKKAGVSNDEIDKIRNLVTVSAPVAGASNTAENAPSQSTSQDTVGQSSSIPQSDNAIAAPPSGSGMVWANLDSKIYHREGDRWYAKTKHGKYMTEADAEKAGYRAAKTGNGKE